jgi:photosystem II stability/assembly factor-like uncharacterized protein
MKKLFIFFCLSALSLSCKDDSTSPFSEGNPTEIPHDFMFMQRAYPAGRLKENAYGEAVAWKKNKLAQRASANAVWEFVGPLNIGGRITDIEIPIDNEDIYYVGAASGGIFKTIDAGITFNPIFDDQDMLSIGDIEISKITTNTVWVGTGEVNAGGGSLAYDGDGVYKSEDGGLTWESKGLPAVGSIGKVLIDPNDEDTVFVGAMGPLFRDDTNRGVYRTTDGGETWEKVLFISDVAGVIDMAIHPTDGNILYAASWHRIRRPENRIYGGEGSGLWRSLDGGDTWEEMTNGLPTAPSQKGRISIAIAPSNPDVLYARYVDAIGAIQGVYRSQDGGLSWQEQNSSQLTNVGFHWWFRGVVVDPEDENIIYNVDFEVQKSTNGGQSWAPAFPGVHVDQHAMAFTTTGASEILLGNDGGLYQSANEGVSSSKFETLPITQFYRFHVDAQNENKMYGGSQDNNTIRTTTGSTDDWQAIYGGDGFQPLVDPTDTTIIYALFQRGNLAKSTNNGASFNTALNGIAGSDRKNWDTPIAFDPSNPETLYYGANRLYKTINGAGNWTAISPDLTDGPYSGNLTFGTIISISVSELDTNVIYVGTDDGNIWITSDGGNFWENISGSLPNRWVTKVLADRNDANTVYATFSGYRYGEDEGHVYRSTDFGANWTDISEGIPDIPVNDIIKDRYNVLYIATDIGVVVSGDEGQNWEPLATNLPSVPVTDMHLHEGNEYLYIATYGRSSYKLNTAGNILNNTENVLLDSLKMYPNPATDVVDFGILNSASDLEVTVYDALGRMITSEILQIKKRNASLNIAHLPKGVYYITISAESKKIIKKLIKK